LSGKPIVAAFLVACFLRLEGRASAHGIEGGDLPAAPPEALGFDGATLVELAAWVRDSKLPIYSVLRAK